MKNLNETFEDREFNFLKKVKADKTWREFILELTNYKKEAKEWEKNSQH